MIGLVLALALAAGQPDAPAAHSERPPGCPKDFVCLPTKEAADLAVELADLRAKIAALEASKKSNFGPCFGAGLAIGAMPVASGSSWDWKMTGGPVVGVTWGWRPR
jgi:hypothetical protein